MVCWNDFSARVYRAFGSLLFVALVLSACTDDNPSSLILDMESSSSASGDAGGTKLPFVGGPVMFTEVDPVNVDFKDHEGDDAGWVELFNTSADTVNLSEMYLTDSWEEPFKWKLGDVKMAPNSFLVIFLSGKNYPDYVMPHDSIDMIGSGCWTWTDAESDPPGYSYADPLPGYDEKCFSENGQSRIGTVMKLGENEELGWSSISFFVGTGSSDPSDVLDISAANEILIQAYITKGRNVSVRLAQPDIDDWKGYEMVLEGTGDSSTVYRMALPTGTTFPDLANIYGTRLSPEASESQEVTLKVFSYIARNRGHEPHAGFKLSKKGGSLYLVNADASIVDSVSYPELPLGKTWNYGGSWGYADPSPYGYSSSLTFTREENIDTLLFPPSGFYTEPFVLNLESTNNAVCETGGKLPSEETVFQKSILINKTTVIRCAKIAPQSLPSDVVTRTYIFEAASTVPAVFLTTDPNSLFDLDTGIYMEGPNAQSKEPHYGANYWLDKEIPVTVELMEPGTSSPAFAKNAGLKIFGNYSRQNDKKSVAITFREKYGDSHLKYPLFPEFPELNKFKVFLLRNNGSNYGNDYIRDRLASSVSEGLGVDYQRGRFAVVYYNGEYFGIHSIRERSTADYFETHYGLDPDKIDLLKADNAVSAGSAVDYVALMDWLESNHLDKEENYAYIASQIDVDNFINYMHTELFANNRDWPANNLKKWRNTSSKTPWKWFLYDLDFGFGNDYSKYKNNIFEFATAEDGESWPNGPESTLLFRRLLENEGFKAAFINRMAVLLQMNFESSRVLARIEKMMAEIQSEISRDQKRWGLSASKMTKQLNAIKNFAMNRPSVVYGELQEFFALGETAAVSLSVSGSGRILVHNLPVDVSKMTVNFFTGFPVTLSAEPLMGSTFAGWSDGESSPTRVILPECVSEVTAIFK
ncbi:CotH protein [Fibrobacter sp. UWB13]|nr:CotH protein [Fibrobacter sp. UWB13]